RTNFSRFDSFRLSRQLSLTVAVVAVFICLLLLRGPLMADPQATFFFKAQQLQAQGLTELALKHYQLISDLHPDSAYAPASLKAQADIVAGLARKNADNAQFQEAITLYRRLADTYSSDRASGEALLTAAAIAKEDLRDRRQAQEILGQVLERFANNAGYASRATLQLGRLALESNQKDAAKVLLQRVLQNFPRLEEACAEAQYHLGVLYETLFKNRKAAEDAYHATYKRYPRTVWASNAQERLGLLIFQRTDKHPERLVLIEVEPVPDEGNTDGDGDNDILEALRPLLAARGLSYDATTLRGWSLTPFWAVFDPNNPGRVIKAPSAFNNVASNAGLLFDRRQGADEKAALITLQRELDAARPAVIYNGTWRLVVGYDSGHQEVFVQSRGARVQALAVKEFLAGWKQKSPGGGPFTLMTFFAPGEKQRLSRLTPDKARNATGAIERGASIEIVNATPTLPTIDPRIAEPTPTPVPTPVPLGLTPAYVFQLKSLSTPNAHRRTLRRAVALMRRASASNNDSALLNIEALDSLATALEGVARTSTVVAKPTPQEIPTSPVPLPEDETATEEAAPTTAPLPAATSVSTSPAASASKVQRLRQLSQWFGAPLQNWIVARRNAASYLRGAAGPLRRSQLNQAADNLRLSIKELNAAAAALPSGNLEENGQLSESARRALLEVARHVRAARVAETRAAQQMEF
ncbi:MAG TPA: tetratricopeptide repeat protein, partial [Abditibacteriaceae bacterium]